MRGRYFFKIQESAFGAVKVELREQRKRFGSRHLESVYVWPGDHPSGHVAISRAKRKALDDHAFRIESARKFTEALEGRS